MLRNRGEDYNDFVTESYYYRDLIKGKKVSPCPNDYNSSIQTQKQYEEWLKQKHQELTKKPKKRGCRTNVRQLILYSTQNAGLRKARRLWYN